MNFDLCLIGRPTWRGEPIRGERLHVLLCSLVDAGDRGASSEALVDAIWGIEAPVNPTKALQVLVSRLRAATSHRIVETTPLGYRLNIDRTRVDVLVRRDLLSHAQESVASGDYAAAHESASTAMTLEPGPVAHRIVALTHSHLGHHEEAVRALEEVLSLHPHDDDAIAALLRSLSVARSPAAALERFDQIRRMLANDLGVSPSPRLAELHQELLAADAPVRSGITFATTSLVGRSHDIDAVGALLETCRLVSIIGPGGLGKTRLARTLAEHTARPVVFVVELAGTSTPEEVPGVIADAINLRESVSERPQGSTGLLPRLADHLLGASTLLVLDNCEHVISVAADTVAFLLAQVPNLTVLTTSRTPLHLTGEHVYPLQELSADDAVALFRDRARAARPGADLDESVISEITDHLDGLPLAIELAASQVRSMSVQEVLINIPGRVSSLRAADRTAPSRHRTLGSVIEWSWQMLTAGERRALEQVALFPDGVTNDSARTILGPDGPEVLSALGDHSLLKRTDRGGALRYRMLQTVREFATSQLQAGGGADAAGQAFLGWAAARCLQVPERVFTSAQLCVIRDLREESVNLLEALRLAEERKDPGATVAILGALAPYWLIAGDDFRVFDQMERIEAILGGWEPSESMAEAAGFGLAIIALMWAMMPLRALPERISRILDSVQPLLRDPYTHAFCVLARRIIATPDFHREPHVLLGRMTELTASPDRHIAMCAAPFVAGAQENSGDPRAAIATITAALSRTRHDDAPWLPSVLRMMLAGMYGQIGEFTGATAYARGALPFLEEISADSDTLQCRTIIALAALNRGDLEDAARRFAEVDETYRSGRARGPLLALILGQAELAFQIGDTARGLELLDEALTETRNRRTPLDAHAEALSPWRLLTDGATLSLRAWYDPSKDPQQWLEQLHVARQAAHPDQERVDYPVLGTLLFGLGLWGVRRSGLPTSQAAGLFAAAEAMTYNRSLPALSWQRARQELDGRDADVLDLNRPAFTDLRGRELLRATTELLRTIVPADRT